MFKHDLPRDQHLLHARIGFDKPMNEFTKNFFIPGDTIHEQPRISVSPRYEVMPVPSVSVAGSKVPIVYMRSGYIQFDIATWGIKSATDGTIDYVRKSANRKLGFPGMIPASFIDIATDPEKMGDDNITAARLRASDGGNLYLACVFLPGPNCTADSVALLVREPGPSVALHIDWQPLFIPVSLYPATKNSDFIARRDNGWLQAPPPRWSSSKSVKVELIHGRAARDIAAE